MKVGYVLTTFPSRTETFAAREIESLRKLGLDITVFAASKQGSCCGYTEPIKTLYRPSWISTDTITAIVYVLTRYPGAFGRLLGLALKLRRFFPKEAASLVGNLHTICFFAMHLDREGISHIHAYFFSWPALIGLGLSIATGRAFSISAHARDIFVEQGAAELKVSRAKFVAVCTQQGLEKLQTYLPNKYHDKLHLVRHGTETLFKSTDGHPKGDCESRRTDVVIAVGRLTQKKGLEVLIRAFALVARHTVDCKFLIVGDGPGRTRLRQLVERLALEDRVELLGWQEPETTLQLIRQATLLVAPSIIAQDGDRDGTPNVILEAFASGVPVVASSLAGIEEAVKHRQTGLLVEAGDIKGLAAAVNELLDSADLRTSLSERAYEMRKRHFDVTKNAGRLAELFRRSN
ncbi:MAG: glycosyltransferase family 4 protein [Planctomycetota bacterium]|jgi:glycosyltransferase involved in cell wall biosynthesis